MIPIKNLLLLLLCTPLVGFAGSLTERQDVQDFAELVKRQHGLEKAYVLQALAQAEVKAGILESISRPVERTLVWHQYRDIFIQADRINAGKHFLQSNRATLLRSQQKFGVPAEITTAIIGVETKFGAVMGKHRVLDALATLAFEYPKRARFFRKELQHFLLLCKEQGLNPVDPLGSYAGAMGYGQFMPSSYRHYAVDFDEDGQADIWNNPVDAIGSVANYLARHGWQENRTIGYELHLKEDQDAPSGQLNKALKPTVSTADLSTFGLLSRQTIDPATKLALFEFKTASEPLYWAGAKNFYVITRYNHSRLYAMAVLTLSEAIGGL